MTTPVCHSKQARPERRRTLPMRLWERCVPACLLPLAFGLALAACGQGAPRPNAVSGSAPAGGVPAASNPPPPSQPGTSITGKIAFTRDGNIWVYSGSSAKQVTTIGSAADPAWSPDGQTLAFDKQDKNSADLYLMSYPSGALKQLSNNASRVVENNLWDMQPDWTPDGLALAFISDRGRARTGTLDPAVWQLTLSSGARTELSRANQYTGGTDFPRWRPNHANQLAYTSWVYDSSSLQPYGQLMLLNTTTGNALALTPDGQSAMQPGWSPNGDSLAYIGRASRTDELRVMSLTSTSAATPNAVSTVAPDIPPSTVVLQGMVAHPVWSPDGKAIAYIGLKDGSFDLFVQPLTADLQPDGPPKQLTAGLHIEAASAIAWSR
jgi:Tol biopolymer transport system component